MTARQQIIVRDDTLRQRVLDLIAALNLEKPWSITIERHRKKRSLSQNALMWKWIDEVVEHVYRQTGQDKEDIHAFFKAKYLKPKRVEIASDCIVYHTTRTLTTADMSEYMEAIYAFCASELGLYLPLPVELGRAEFKTAAQQADEAADAMDESAASAETA